MESVVARISGVDLPREKRIETALTYIYGIGDFAARQIVAKSGVPSDRRTKDLSEDEIRRIREIIEQGHKVEGDLRRELQQAIKRLTEIGCYRGLRHRRRLPARGQRTRTNARTMRGPRKTVPGRRKAGK